MQEGREETGHAQVGSGADKVVETFNAGSIIALLLSSTGLNQQVRL